MQIEESGSIDLFAVNKTVFLKFRRVLPSAGRKLSLYSNILIGLEFQHDFKRCMGQWQLAAASL